jgi:DNA invertase Pin-like site-specific DNA recombinase
MVWGYVRCSTQEQGDFGLSLESQRARIAAWCEAACVSLGELVEDQGVSGSRPLATRPGGRKVAELLSKRKSAVSAIVVVRLDRLGRDAAETLQLLKKFTDGPVGLVSIAERLDLTTPQGRAMAGVAAVFAELERSLIGERTAEALNRLREDGRLYGPVPFGYDAVEGQLVPNEGEQVGLGFMRSMRERGMSYAAIASWLNSEGIPGKRGGVWYPMSVRSVLLTSGRLGIGDGRKVA